MIHYSDLWLLMYPSPAWSPLYNSRCSVGILRRKTMWCAWVVGEGWHLFLYGVTDNFFFFRLFRATTMAYGDSQARGQIRAVATGLCHSNSNARSKPQPWPVQQLAAMLDPLTHWARPGIKPASSWILVRFLTSWATMGPPSNWKFFTVSHCSRRWLVLSSSAY